MLFLYLLDNRFRKTWSIDLADLKALLNCNAERYKQFKFFNAEILKKCHKELCEKTDISFEYKPIKRGRTVSAVEFSVNTLNDELTEQLRSVPLELDSIAKNGEFVGQTNMFTDEIDYGSELANLLGGSACDDEFSPEQVRVLQDLVLKAVPQQDNMLRCNYLIEQVHRMNMFKPKNRFAYLCTIIKNDIEGV